MGAIERAHAAGRARWARTELSLEHFRAFVKGKSLEAHPDELFLAAACGRGDPGALREFEKAYLSLVPDFVAKTDASAAFADEVKQQLRDRLFVEGHIAGYSGAGPLGAWLRVAAARTALNLKRVRKADAPGRDHALELNAHQPDPELDYLKSRYGAELRAAFRKVLADLPARNKSLLALYYLEGLSAAAIAQTFKVHAATVRRWIDEARSQIVDETYALLKERLDLSSQELQSLLKAVQSQLELSISRLLR